MVKKILFGILFLISITAYSQTNYYVKNGGNDDADGLSDVNAWETLSKVNSMDFTAGDTIFFNRGDTWSGQRINPREGTAEQGTEDAPIVFAAYGSGAKPIIQVCDSLYGWTGAGNWRLQTTNVYAIEFKPPVSRFLVDEGAGLAEIRKSETRAGITSTLRYYIANGVDSLYFYSTGNPATTYTNIIATYPDELQSTSFRIYGDDWITAYNLDLRGGYYSAYVSRGIGIVFDSCRIGNYSGYFGLSIGGVTGDSSRYITVKNCEIDAGGGFEEDWECKYTENGVNIGGETYVVTIQDNYIKNWGHSSVYLRNTASTNFNDSIYVIDNEFTSPDINYGRAVNVDIYGKNATNVYFLRNYIHDIPTTNQINCYGLEFSYNIIDGVVGSSWYPGVGTGITISGYASTSEPQNMKFYNNVIANCVDDGIYLSHYTGRAIKSNNEFVNNIIYNCGGSELHVYCNTAISGIYDNIYRNNLFYNSGTDDVVNYWETAMTVDEFNDENGTQGDVIQSNIGADPAFDGATFELLSTSPAINAGIDVGLTTDYAGTAVPQGIYFDIGAYEFTGFPIATTGLGWENHYAKKNFKDDVNFEKGFSVEGVPINFSGGSLVNIPELNILDGATFTTDGTTYSLYDGATQLAPAIPASGQGELSDYVPLLVDTIPLFVFGGGGGNTGDTTVFTTSTIYGAFFNAGSDTLVVTELRACMTPVNGSDTLDIDILWDVNLNDASPTKLNTTPLPVNSSTTGTVDTVFDNAKIPPGVWVWCETPAVIVGRKPTLLIVQLSGYKIPTY